MGMMEYLRMPEEQMEPMKPALFDDACCVGWVDRIYLSYQAC